MTKGLSHMSHNSKYPEHLEYTAEHEWVDTQGDTVTFGITPFAAEALGDIVYVDLPAVGSRLEAGSPCGEVESTKSVSDLFAPTTGTVLEINTEAIDDPGMINAEPFAVWLCRVAVESTGELLSVDEYQAIITAGE